MPDRLDPYKTLQVDSEAEDEVIQAAYRRLARKYHPDVAGDDAADRMSAINAAWDLIGDPRRAPSIRRRPGDPGARGRCRRSRLGNVPGDATGRVGGRPRA